MLKFFFSSQAYPRRARSTPPRCGIFARTSSPRIPMLDPTKAFAASRAATSRTAGREMKYGHHRPVYGTLQFIESQAMPVLPDRPARVQVEQKRKLQQAEHLGEYNIWYHRWSGENNYERAPRASTRCVLETDAGLTRADYTNPGAPPPPLPLDAVAPEAAGAWS